MIHEKCRLFLNYPDIQDRKNLICPTLGLCHSASLSWDQGLLSLVTCQNNVGHLLNCKVPQLIPEPLNWVSQCETYMSHIFSKASQVTVIWIRMGNPAPLPAVCAQACAHGVCDCFLYYKFLCYKLRIGAYRMGLSQIQKEVNNADFA